MPHSYGPATISGGLVVQGDSHQHHSVHHHHYALPGKDSVDTILAWLSHLNFAATLQFHCNKRTPDTGQWLLKDSKFQRWRTPEASCGRILWCRGNPGSGKTILCSMVIQSLKETAADSEAVIYCFFDYARREDLSADAVMADLLCQLCRKRPSTTESAARKLYDQAERGRRRPTLVELSAAFKRTCESFTKVSVIIDALDECEHHVRRHLISSLDLTASPNVILLIMSRPHIRISMYTSEGIVEIEVQAHDSDLRLFLENRIADNEDLGWVLASCDSGAEMITDHIIEKAASSFLAAEMRLNSVQYALTPAQLLGALQNELTNLAELYDDTLKRIKTQQSTKASLAISVLGWLSRVRRPLTGRELCHAIALQSCEGVDSMQKAYTVETVLSSCQGLVVQDQHTEQMRLLHYTLLEYFEEQKTDVICDNAALESCLKCLCSPELSKLVLAPGAKQSTIAFTHLQVIRQLPFVLYATEYWTAHVQADRQDTQRLLVFLESKDKLDLWRRMLVFHMPSLHKQWLKAFRGTEERLLSGHYIALSMGWTSILSSMLEREEVSHSQLGNMLCLAVRGRSLQITELLLSKGVDASSRDEDGYSALHYACTADTDAFVTLLIRSGGNPDQLNRKHRTPLLEGLMHHENVQALAKLLDVGARTICTDVLGENALHTAVRFRQPKTIIETIINTDVPLDARNHNGDTALHLAVRGQDFQTAELLVSHGADSAVLNNKGEAALHYLLLSPSQMLLLERCLVHCSDLGIRNSHNESLLHHAINTGHSALMINFLLQQHPALNKMQDSQGNSALHLAVAKRDIAIAESLLEHGAEIDVRNNEGRTALHLALYHRRPDVVIKTLLLYKATVDLQDNMGKSALHLACRHFQPVANVKMLLQHNASVGLTDYDGNTALHQTLRDTSSRQLSELLLQYGADVNKKNKFGSTGLHFAVQYGSDMLLSRRLGAPSTSFPDHMNVTSTVRLLIDYGSEILAQDTSGNTPLHVLINQAHKFEYQDIEALVDMLWHRSGSANSRDESGQTPMYLAYVLASEGDKLFLHSGRQYSAKKVVLSLLRSRCQVSSPTWSKTTSSLLEAAMGQSPDYLFSSRSPALKPAYGPLPEAGIGGPFDEIPCLRQQPLSRS